MHRNSSFTRYFSKLRGGLIWTCDFKKNLESRNLPCHKQVQSTQKVNDVIVR